ncbi:NAD(P)(+) transhydrogenase (Re/Si-specific) subunit beta [Natrialbaceae archaeon AArc-T1-2]|uniref:NAD(P)(+) transhydrogenase (Re/Si-specific) subunit beta n=1 Tax=Natrialbaceae archaeon AArc-T1-2 TaxID=3053904 RepID=UPI00255AF1C8|nr:NAD(P)(+) transhydrogenase (Re/Si-specific) subunit beta [Natrialbaceae archaeon AArc-T1-2]WIV66141.1 NAD(P)(+) transhydrogenase (Re/Si-specific) subunit beta [Natrialbaceae archaeon AArc-T1-2]
MMVELIGDTVLSAAYLFAAVLFIQGLRDMTHPRTAVRGNLTSAGGMFVAVAATVLWFEIIQPWVLIAGLVVGTLVGVFLSVTVEMTEMPQLVGLFNGFGGGASALVAGAEVLEVGSANAGAIPVDIGIAAAASGIVGAVTFTGSMVAAGKLHGMITGSAIRYSGEHAVKALLLLVAVFAGIYMIVQPEMLADVLQGSTVPSYWILVVAAAVLGIMLVIPIGGADMPVVIALLNSYSGLAAAGTGFVLGNSALIIAGTLVGAAGMILTVIMCESMNRSLANVLFGGFGEEAASSEEMDEIYEGNITETSPEELEMLLDTAGRVVIVPGYGMAVAQAQHAVAELAELLDGDDVEVEFGIHPVAGRMPGHMNVLLAEADVPYDMMKELEEINPTFAQTDVVIVIGSNDVVNPLANTDDSSPIAGMPVLNVAEAGTVVVNKRSLSPGFSGIPNPLFAEDNCLMLFGDGQETMQEVVSQYKESH